MKVAVITPYYREPDEWVAAMLDSVAAQTHPVTHVLVGDGVRRDGLDGDGRVHMNLPQPVNDSGGTPRAAAGAWAVQNGFEMVVYVDADDRLAPNCVASLVRAHQRVGGEVLSVPHAYYDRDMRPARNMLGQHVGVWAVGSARHIGGKLFAFMPAGGLALAGRALAHVRDWMRVPPELRRVHDVIFSQALISKPYTLVWMAQAHYHYRMTRAHQYESFGVPVPPDLGTAEKDEAAETAIRLLSRLDEAGRRELESRFGIDAGKLPDRDGVRDAVANAHQRRGVFVRRDTGKFEVVAPL